MDKSIGVHVSNGTRDLSEDKKESCGGEVSLAELFPEVDVVG